MSSKRAAPYVGLDVVAAQSRRQRLERHAASEQLAAALVAAF